MSSRLSFSSLRVRLLILVFISVVPAFMLVLFIASVQKNNSEAQIKADTLETAKIAANNIEQLAEGSRKSSRSFLNFMLFAPMIQLPAMNTFHH